jgi:hypothetical protein
VTYRLSYRDLSAMMAERDVAVSQRPDDLHELLIVEDAAALATLNSSA